MPGTLSMVVLYWANQAQLREASGRLTSVLRARWEKPEKTSPAICSSSNGLGAPHLQLMNVAAPTTHSCPSESPLVSRRTCTDDSLQLFAWTTLASPTVLFTLHTTTFHPHKSTFDTPPRQRAGRKHVARRRAARMGRCPRAPDFPRLLQGARPHVWYVFNGC